MSTSSRLYMPDEQLAGIIQVAYMSDANFEELLHALENTPPTFFVGDFVDKVAEQATHTDHNAVDQLLSTLGGLYFVRTELDRETQEIVDQVTLDVQDADESTKPPGGDWDMFPTRLHRLLSLGKTFGVVAKTLALRLRSENVMRSIRITTDLRPIFTDTVEDGPQAAIIMHQMQISYSDNSARKQFFFSLDSTDIGEIRAALDRAEEKAAQLQKIVTIPVLKEDAL